MFGAIVPIAFLGNCARIGANRTTGNSLPIDVVDTTWKDTQDSRPFESKLTTGGVVPSLWSRARDPVRGANFPGGSPPKTFRVFVKTVVI